MSVAVKQGFKLASEVRAAVIAGDAKTQAQWVESDRQRSEAVAVLQGPEALKLDPQAILDVTKRIAAAEKKLGDLEAVAAKKVRDGIISGVLAPIRDHDDSRILDHVWNNEYFASNYLVISEKDSAGRQIGVSRKVLVRFSDEEVADFIAYLGVKFVQPNASGGRIQMALYYAVKETFPKGVPETMPLRVVGERIKKTAAFNAQGLSASKLDNGSYQPSLSRVLGRSKK